ncbi:MAG: hypothetical protein AAF721_26290 [Myxococcota bacterium]
MIVQLLALMLIAPPQAGPDVVLEDYVVVKGDNCAKIARRRFGQGRHYHILHQYNEMGPLPHKLVPGTVLRLPAKVPTPPDAELTRTQREVQARAPKEGSWSTALEGLDLFRGWRVNTLQRAFAEVTFRDSTQIHLRENTLVIIYGATGATARRSTTTATLDRGALRSSLGALSGGAKLEVDTPSASTKLEGGWALVTVDDAGASRVANHGDGKANVASKTKKRKRVRVAKGMGSKVEKGREPTPPKPLPATPVWTPGTPTVFVVPAGGGGTLRGSWGAVAKAHGYRVELGQDTKGGFVSTAVTVPGNVTQFEAHNLAAGKYFAIVSAVDDDAFESIPSRMFHAELREAGLQGGGGTTIDIPAASEEPVAPKPLPVLMGTRLTPPPGLRCAFGAAELSDAPVATQVGEHDVHCKDDAGADVGGFGVLVYGVQVAPSGAFSDGIALSAGEPTPVTLELQSPGSLPATMTAAASEGVTISDLDTSVPGKISLVLTATPEAVARGELQLLAGDHVIGTTPYAVAPPATADPEQPLDDDEPRERAPWIKRHPPTRGLVELGAFGGVFVPHPQLELFEFTLDRPDFGYRRLQSVSFAVGPRVSYGLLRFLALEADAAVMPSSAGDSRATLWAARGSVVGQLGLWSVTPYALLGAGAFGVASEREAVGVDVDPALHFGAGVKLYLSPRIMVRVEGRDTLSGQRGIADGVAHSLEVTAGVGVTLNRKRKR